MAVESTFNWYWLVDGLQDAWYGQARSELWGAEKKNARRTCCAHWNCLAGRLQANAGAVCSRAAYQRRWKRKR